MVCAGWIAIITISSWLKAPNCALTPWTTFNMFKSMQVLQRQICLWKFSWSRLTHCRWHHQGSKISLRMQWHLQQIAARSKSSFVLLCTAVSQCSLLFKYGDKFPSQDGFEKRRGGWVGWCICQNWREREEVGLQTRHAPEKVKWG